MKLFGWLITREEQAPASVLDRLEHAENALAKLSRSMKELEVDWEGVLDKIARYTARQAARSRREIAAGAEEPSAATQSEAPEARQALRITQPMSKAQVRAALASGQLRRQGG